VNEVIESVHRVARSGHCLEQKILSMRKHSLRHH